MRLAYISVGLSPTLPSPTLPLLLSIVRVGGHSPGTHRGPSIVPSVYRCSYFVVVRKARE
jgi:hypothetical protein